MDPRLVLSEHPIRGARQFSCPKRDALTLGLQLAMTVLRSGDEEDPAVRCLDLARRIDHTALGEVSTVWSADGFGGRCVESACDLPPWISIAPNPTNHIDRICALEQIRGTGVFRRLLQRRDHHLQRLGCFPRIFHALQYLSNSYDYLYLLH